MCIGTCLEVNRNFVGILAISFAAALVQPGQAGEAIVANPAAEAKPGISYADLVALAVPGARLSGETIEVERDVALRHIDGAEFSVPLSAPVAVSELEAAALMLEGRPHLALLIGLAEGDGSIGPVTGLALFDVSGAPKLIDVADVGFDRLVSFTEPASLAVGGGNELLLISNQHLNAGQFYDAVGILEVEHGKLALVDTVLMLSDQGCAGSRTQSIQYGTDGEAAERAPVQISVTDRIEGPTEDCEDATPFEPSETVYSVTYGWDWAAGRYVAAGDGWAALDAVNEGRF